jgi:hypothetical protein
VSCSTSRTVSTPEDLLSSGNAAYRLAELGLLHREGPACRGCTETDAIGLSIGSVTANCVVEAVSDSVGTLTVMTANPPCVAWSS